MSAVFDVARSSLFPPSLISRICTGWADFLFIFFFTFTGQQPLWCTLLERRQFQRGLAHCKGGCTNPCLVSRFSTRTRLSHFRGRSSLVALFCSVKLPRVPTTLLANSSITVSFFRLTSDVGLASLLFGFKCFDREDLPHGQVMEGMVHRKGRHQIRALQRGEPNRPRRDRDGGATNERKGKLYPWSVRSTSLGKQLRRTRVGFRGTLQVLHSACACTCLLCRVTVCPATCHVVCPFCVRDSECAVRDVKRSDGEERVRGQSRAVRTLKPACLRGTAAHVQCHTLHSVPCVTRHSVVCPSGCTRASAHSCFVVRGCALWCVVHSPR